jgi:endonuclease YncB( thermonuclease family)
MARNNPSEQFGIDTPEKSRKKNDPGQPYSQRATRFLAGRVLNQDVSIKFYGNDWKGFEP